MNMISDEAEDVESRFELLERPTVLPNMFNELRALLLTETGDTGGLGDIMSERLVEFRPEMKSFFAGVGETTAIGSVLDSMIRMLLSASARASCLGSGCCVCPYQKLRVLGKLHSNRNVSQDDQFMAFGKALAYAIKRQHGDRFGPHLQESFTHVFSAVVNGMKAAHKGGQASIVSLDGGAERMEAHAHENERLSRDLEMVDDL